MRKATLSLISAFILISALMRADGGGDSLRKALANAANPKEQLNALRDLCFYYSNNCNDSIRTSAYELIDLAKALKQPYNMVQGHYFLAKYFKNHQELDSARAHLALAFQCSAGNSAVRANAWIAYYDYYVTIGISDSALYCLLKARDAAEDASDLQLQAGVLNRIGNFYAGQEAYTKALPYYQQSLEMWQKVDKTAIAGVLSDIGNAYYYLRDYPNALKYYLWSYKVNDENNNVLGYGYSLNNIGLVYSGLGNTKKALEYFNRSLSFYQHTQNKEGIANIFTNLGKENLKNANYHESLKDGEEALKMASSLQLKPLILDAYTIMAESYEGLGDYKMASSCRKEQVAYTDSILNINMLHKVADMQTKYAISRKEAENHALKAQQASQELIIQKQRYTTIIIAIVLVLFMLLALIYWRSSRERKERVKILQAQNDLIESKNRELAGLNTAIMHQKKQLEETNSFKDKLFSLVSHDVRTPLSSLQGLLMFLASGEDIPHDTLIAMLKDVGDKVQHTSSFLDNLLSWAKSQLDGYRPNVHEMDLKVEVDSIFSLYLQQLSNKHIHTQNHIPAGTHIVTDTNLMRLILRNLITNAIKFTHEHGTISICTEWHEDMLKIQVKDNGIGMLPEVQAKLFSGKGFTTLGTAKEKGTGLGLTLCKDFIERLNGRISVHSEIGKGSTFTVSLPAKLYEAIALEAQPT